jgi:hypothetical protein
MYKESILYRPARNVPISVDSQYRNVMIILGIAIHANLPQSNKHSQLHPAKNRNSRISPMKLA